MAHKSNIFIDPRVRRDSMASRNIYFSPDLNE